MIAQLKNTSHSFRIFFSVFIVFNIILSSFFLDIWPTWNTTSRTLTVLAVCHHHTLNIDTFQLRTQDKCFVNGHYYSEKAPLPALITIPFYYLIKSDSDLIDDENGVIGKPDYLLGGFLCGSLPLVFIVSLIFLNIYKEKSIVSAVFLSMLPIYGSFLFLYSGTFLNHLMGGALLLAAYVFLQDKKNLFAAGIFSGLAFLSDFPLGIALPVWALQIYLTHKSAKSIWHFVGGFMPSLLFILAFNYFITGNPFKMLYQFVSNEEFVHGRETLGFAVIHFDALWQMLFSMYRGIFIYFPILIFLFTFLSRVTARCSRIPSTEVK